MRRAAAHYSCSGGLADDRPMSGLRLIASGDSLLNYNVAVSIVVQLYSCCYQFKCQICLTYPCAIVMFSALQAQLYLNEDSYKNFVEVKMWAFGPRNDRGNLHSYQKLNGGLTI